MLCEVKGHAKVIAQVKREICKGQVNVNGQVKFQVNADVKAMVNVQVTVQMKAKAKVCMTSEYSG